MGVQSLWLHKKFVFVHKNVFHKELLLAGNNYVWIKVDQNANVQSGTILCEGIWLNDMEYLNDSSSD